MSPSAREYDRALRELRRLQRRDRCLFPMDRGWEFPDFIARLQDNLDAMADAEFLSRVARAMLKVASALRVEGD